MAKVADEVRYDIDKIRQGQLDNYANSPDDQKPIVRDDNPEGSARNYASLSRVWSPLILDVVGQDPWTLEEILNALGPVIRKFGKEYTRLSPSYEMDDAESDAAMALLDALRTDKGVAPFANFAANSIRRAIMRGAKAAKTIKTPGRKSGYSSRTASLATPTATGKGDLASMQSATSGKAEAAICRNCAIEDPKTGELKVNKSGIDPETGELCTVCGGSGTVPTEYEADPSELTHTSQELAIRQEELDEQYAQLAELISKAGLTQRQRDAALMRFGVEGFGGSGLHHTDIPKMPQAAANMMAAGDEIYRKGDPFSKTDDSGVWIDAQNTGRGDEFNQIWTKHAGRPFDPDVSPTLQLAQLQQKVDDKVESKVDDLMNDMRAAFGHEPKTLSKNLANTAFKVAMKRLKAAATDEAAAESIQKLDTLNYELVLEGIRTGEITDIDDATSIYG